MFFGTSTALHVFWGIYHICSGALGPRVLISNIKDIFVLLCNFAEAFVIKYDKLLQCFRPNEMLLMSDVFFC